MAPVTLIERDFAGSDAWADLRGPGLPVNFERVTPGDPATA